MLLQVLRALLLLLFAGFFPSLSQDAGFSPPADKRCPGARFAGEVSAGKRFEREFGDGLVFRLLPAAGGWETGIHEKSDSERKRDFLMIATPPYRFWNPRYIDTSYGHSAKETVAIRTRAFFFVPTRQEFEAFNEAVEKALFSGHSEKEANEGTEILLNEPRCRGELRILDSKIEDRGNKG